MQTNILWAGREYHSMENCLVKTTETGSEVNSVIIGEYDQKIYRVEYRIKTNPNWETLIVELTSQHSNEVQRLRLECDGKGNWKRNGKEAAEFAGCIDVDIPLTPFTNSLPINRLRMKKDEVHQIRVIYLDLLENEIKPVRQQYTRLSETTYLYQNVPNDFEAKIEVDELGLVVDYPLLFFRTASSKARYPDY